MWVMRAILWVFFLAPWLKHLPQLMALRDSEALGLGAFTVAFTLMEAIITADYLRGFIHGETRDTRQYGDPLVSAQKNPVNFVWQMLTKSVMVAAMVGLTFLVMLHT